MAATSCCPADSWPAMQVDYSPKGVISQVDLPDGTKMDVYKVGKSDTDYVIYLNYDVFGLVGGRTKAMADTLAELCQCECIIVDIFLGDKILDLSEAPQFIPKYGSSVVLPRFQAVLKDEKRKVAMVGVCYGAYCNAILTAKDVVPTAFCSVWWHPSVRVAPMFNEVEAEITEKIVVPTSILAAEVNDPEQYHPGGASILSLEKTAPGSECLPLAKGMSHGWTCRGDLNIPEVKDQVQNAIDNFKRFYDQCKAKL